MAVAQSAAPAPVKIAVNGLEVEYRDGRGATPIQALAGVDLEIFRGEVLALIGPSGCGKSTFLRVLNRMNETIPGSRIAGKVTLDGEDIYAKRFDVISLRRRVGMVFQRAQLFPMSVWDNVAYGLRAHGLRDRHELAHRVESALLRTGLWSEVRDRLDAPARVLSAGQAQRLCIARALAVEPEVLLMDEPTSALDPIATARLEELVQDLRSTLTVVVVTHSMQQAARVSQRTAFFFMGRLVEVGPTTRLFTRPAVARTEEYISGRFG